MDKKTEMEKRNRMFYLLFIFALFAHCTMFLLFLHFDIKIMVYFNIGSILLYSFVVFLFRKTEKRSFTLFYQSAGTIEVILHQTFAIICLGTEVGFQYFFIMLVVVVILQPREILNKKGKILLSLLIVCIMIGTELYVSSTQPIYTIPEYIRQIMLVIITSVAISGIVVFAFNQWEIAVLYQGRIEELLSERTDKIYQMQEKIIQNFADIIEERDGSTGNHIKRTSSYVEAIIHALMESGKYSDILTDSYAKMVISAAPLHDIGKISISDVILTKPSKLNPSEYEIMKTHSEIGGSMLNELLGNLESEEYIHLASEISRYHHERWDGTGYPAKLKGEEIPLAARIMAVADVFDALTSERVYKDKISVEEAYTIMESEAGQQFDPAIIAELVRIRPRIQEICNQFN